MNKQRSFNYGQIYVALSRATSLQGLHILGEIQSKHIKANPKVHKEYERLRNSCLRTFTEHKSSNSSFITMSLLNIRSLRKHSNDIKLHVQLFHSDVLAFTETQLLANDSDAEISANLKPFKIYRQDHDSDKYSSMAICIRETLQMVDYEYFPSLNAIKFVLVDTKLQESRSFLLLYRKNNYNVSQYIEALQYLLNIYRIDMALGDFNMNYFNATHSQPLISLMESLNYTQIATEPTFVYAGSLLDHVYVKPTSIQIINSSVVSVYYSDHDAVVTSLQFSNDI